MFLSFNVTGRGIPNNMRIHWLGSPCVRHLDIDDSYSSLLVELYSFDYFFMLTLTSFILVQASD